MEDLKRRLEFDNVAIQRQVRTKIIYKGTNNTVSINVHLEQGLKCTPRTRPKMYT